MPGKDKHSQESIERRDRQAVALRLRRSGAHYRQIAEHLEVSISTAYQYVSDALKEITRESAEEVLQMERDRLNELRMIVMPQAQKGNLKAVDRALRISIAYSRLHGLEQMAAEQAKGDSRDLSDVDKFLTAMLGEKAEEDPDETGGDS